MNVNNSPLADVYFADTFPSLWFVSNFLDTAFHRVGF